MPHSHLKLLGRDSEDDKKCFQGGISTQLAEEKDLEEMHETSKYYQRGIQ